MNTFDKTATITPFRRRTFRDQLPDAERGAQLVRRDLSTMGRIHNVRARVAAIKHHARKLAYLQTLDLELERARAEAWLRPGHWSYTVALGAAITILVGVAGVLGWLLFTTPALGL